VADGGKGTSSIHPPNVLSVGACSIVNFLAGDRATFR
jgi:hypothetical protein